MKPDFLRVLMLALLLLGVVAVAYGVYIYLDARQAIAAFDEIAASIGALDLENMPEAQRQALLSSVPNSVVLDYHEATRDQNLSLVIGGVGLVGVGVGWLGYDWFSRRAARRAAVEV